VATTAAGTRTERAPSLTYLVHRSFYDGVSSSASVLQYCSDSTTGSTA
jgi:hypothetical protein